MDAIRNDRPYNEVERGVQASVVTSMGRMAAHTGVEVTYDEMLNCEHNFAPGVEKLTMKSESFASKLRWIVSIPEPGKKKIGSIEAKEMRKPCC